MHSKARSLNFIVGVSWSPPNVALNILLTLLFVISMFLFVSLSAQPTQAQAFPVTQDLKSQANGKAPDFTCMGSGGPFNIIHSFTQEENGQSGGGLMDPAIDSAGNIYGTTIGGGGSNHLGLVYELSPHGQDWTFTTLFSATGGENGEYPRAVKLGPNGALAGLALDEQSCNGYDCGLVFGLRPAPTVCGPRSCSWDENVLHRFADVNDGWDPRSLVFDHAGNLYGTTNGGGAYGHGTVYELTPSAGSWTEKILYSFTGGSDGGDPGSSTSLALAPDGSVYGTSWGGGAYGFGVVFQLVPVNGAWAEHVLYAFTGQDDGIYPSHLRRDSSGKLFGTSSFQYSWGTVPVRVFTLSASNNGWTFGIVWQAQHHFEYIGGLALDASDNLYGVATNSGEDNTNLYFETFKRTPDGIFQQWGVSGQFFSLDSDLVADRHGNVYGVADFCGEHDLGGVWQFSGFAN
jgi:uncharacterized repeat protein (TIGR03803 family)